MSRIDAHAHRRGGAVVAVAVITSLMSGCVFQGPVPRAPQGDPIEAARELPDAPKAVRTGNAAGSCGEFVLDQGESVPVEAVQCMSTALSEMKDAELAWTVPTVEGDPIVSFAFVTAGSDHVVVHTTNAFDSYGGEQSWTKSSCNNVSAATSSTGCS